MLCLLAQSCPPLWDPMDCSPLGSFVHEDSPSKNTGLGCHAFLQGIFPTQESNPGLKPMSPTLQEHSLPSEPPGKPKYTYSFPFINSQFPPSCFPWIHKTPHRVSIVSTCLTLPPRFIAFCMAIPRLTRFSFFKKKSLQPCTGPNHELHQYWENKQMKTHSRQASFL